MINVVGHWDLVIPGWEQLIEFTNDGKFIQQGSSNLEIKGHMANWEILEDMIVVKYIDEKLGYSVFSPDDENENILYGTHMEANKTKHDWILKKINLDINWLLENIKPMLNAVNRAKLDVVISKLSIS